MEPKRRDPALFIVGLVLTVAMHAGVFAFFWLTQKAQAETRPNLIGTFVDAQLVKFGRPRDMTFLPHKQGVQKKIGPAEGIKVAKDLNALPHLDKETPPDKIDPLKKTHADLFKNLPKDDQPEGFEEAGVGSPTGSKAGTATEAKGDPYILDLIDKIGTAWTVPTTIKDADLQSLSAVACLDIADSGALRGYKLYQKSGNSQFDSSLEAALTMIKNLSPLPDRWKGKKLCPEFSGAIAKR